jgi:hypothetical protein
MRIRGEQLDAIAAGFRRSREAIYAARLRVEANIGVDRVSDGALKEHIHSGCIAAAKLGITHDADVYRFLRLAHVNASEWRKPGIEEVMVRVLTDVTLSSAKRLDFIEFSLLNIGTSWRS